MVFEILPLGQQNGVTVLPFCGMQSKFSALDTLRQVHARAPAREHTGTR